VSIELGSEAPDKENGNSLFSNTGPNREDAGEDSEESDVKVISGDIFPNLLNEQSERY